MERLKSIIQGIKRVSFDGVLLEDIEWLVAQAEKVECYEKALGDINDYIPTRDFKKDVHNLKAIADNILK
jgi:hypothetical protein